MKWIPRSCSSKFGQYTSWKLGGLMQMTRLHGRILSGLPYSQEEIEATSTILKSNTTRQVDSMPTFEVTPVTI